MKVDNELKKAWNMIVDTCINTSVIDCDKSKCKLDYVCPFRPSNYQGYIEAPER